MKEPERIMQPEPIGSRIRIPSVPAFLCTGHGLSDLNQSALSALLPFIMNETALTLAQVSLIVMISNLAGSLCQPVFGLLADRKIRPGLLGISILLACGGISLMSVSANLIWLCFAGAVSGTGVALFHPQAALLLARFSEKRNKSRLMSWFSLGGKAGFCLGPVLAAACMSLGRQGLLLFLIPAVLYGAVCRRLFSRMTAMNDTTRNPAVKKSGQPDKWLLFTGLCVIIIGRSVITNAVSSFSSPLLIDQFALSPDSGSLFLSLSYAVGAVSVLIGGSLADRTGEARLLICTVIVMSAGLVLTAASSSLVMTITGLLVLAAGESLCYSPLIVLSQKLLPAHQGLASGISLGLAVSIGALLVPALGMIADENSVRFVYVILSVLSGFLSIFMLVLFRPLSAAVEDPS